VGECDIWWHHRNGMTEVGKKKVNRLVLGRVSWEEWRFQQPRILFYLQTLFFSNDRCVLYIQNMWIQSSKCG
jgi:hypothetical protein